MLVYNNWFCNYAEKLNKFLKFLISLFNSANKQGCCNIAYLFTQNLKKY